MIKTISCTAAALSLSLQGFASGLHLTVRNLDLGIPEDIAPNELLRQVVIYEDETLDPIGSRVVTENGRRLQKHEEHDKGTTYIVDSGGSGQNVKLTLNKQENLPDYLVNISVGDRQAETHRFSKGRITLNMSSGNIQSRTLTIQPNTYLVLSKSCTLRIADGIRQIVGHDLTTSQPFDHTPVWNSDYSGVKYLFNSDRYQKATLFRDKIVHNPLIYSKEQIETSNQGFIPSFNRHRALTASTNISNSGQILGTRNDSEVSILQIMNSNYGPKEAAIYNHEQGLIDIPGTVHIKTEVERNEDKIINASCISISEIWNEGKIIVHTGELVATSEMTNDPSYTRWYNETGGIVTTHKNAKIGTIAPEKTATSNINKGEINVEGGTLEVLGGPLINYGQVSLKGKIKGKIVMANSGVVEVTEGGTGYEEVGTTNLTEKEHEIAKQIEQQSLAQDIKYFRYHGESDAGAQAISGGVVDENLVAIQPEVLPVGTISQKPTPRYTIFQNNTTASPLKFNDINDLNDFLFLDEGVTLKLDAEPDNLTIQTALISPEISSDAAVDDPRRPVVTLNNDENFEFQSYNHHYHGIIDIHNKARVKITKGTLPPGIIKIGIAATLDVSVGTGYNANKTVFILGRCSTLTIRDAASHQPLNIRITGSTYSAFLYEEGVDTTNIEYVKMFGDCTRIDSN